MSRLSLFLFLLFVTFPLIVSLPGQCPDSTYTATIDCSSHASILVNSTITCDAYITIWNLPLLNNTQSWYVSIANLQYRNIINQQWERLGTTRGSYGWIIRANTDPAIPLDTTNSFGFKGSVQIPTNLVGQYYLFIGLALQIGLESYPFCFPEFRSTGSKIDNNVQYISVINPNPLLVDTLPPEILQYNVTHDDEYITLSVYILEENLINLDNGWNTWLIDPNNYTAGAIDCAKAVWKRVIGDDFPITTRSIVSNNTGWYMTSCAIPTTAIPGVYHLTMLNLFDEYGNMSDYVPQHVTDVVTVEIKKSKSLAIN